MPLSKKIAAINNEETRRLAQDILRELNNKIATNLRYMDAVVFSVTFAESDLSLTSDGRFIYYEPFDIIERFKDSPRRLTHDFMHTLIHCVLKHYFVSGTIERGYRDLAADILVEDVILSFNKACFETSDSKVKRDELAKLKRKRGDLSAQKLYESFLNKPPSEKEFANLVSLFTFDDHSLWYDELKRKSVAETAVIDPLREESSNLGDASASEFSFDKGQDWDKIGDLVRLAIDEDIASRGIKENRLKKELDSMRKKDVNFRTFLNRFASKREVLKVDDASFDNLFYTYGLELYGNMPLIEPLEYSDNDKIRDFVIAIDSSGSTEGALVQSFIETTFTILKQSDAIYRDFNIHLIQCDALVQEDTILRTRKDISAYMQRFTAKGLGGTDFRPVFSYVESLIESGDLSDLKGLLYFTDGKGTYPARKPPYETVFVFVGKDYDDSELPPWAIGTVIDKEDFK